MQSVRVFPKLMSTARISADVLEVPSSLDDAKPPANVILVQAVLPIEKASGNPRSSASMLSGLVGQTTSNATESAERSTNSAQFQLGSPNSLVMPTESAQAGTPFVFTPYTLFNKMQMMLLRGRTAQAFGLEVQQALSDRYDVTLAQLEYYKANKGKGLDQEKFADDTMSQRTSYDKSRQDADGDKESVDEGDDKTHTKQWMPQLNMFGKGIRRQSRPSSSLKQSSAGHDHSDVEMTTKGEESMPSPEAIKSSSASALASAPSYQGASLGIRRFTGDNVTTKSPEVDQSKFVRPVEENEETNSPAVTFSQTSYPPSASRSHKIHGGSGSKGSSRSDSAPLTSKRMSERRDQASTQEVALAVQGTPTQRARSKTIGSSNPTSASSNALRRVSSSQIVIVDEGISTCPDDSIARTKKSLDGSIGEGIQHENGGAFSSRLPFVNALGLPRRPHTVQSTARPGTANEGSSNGGGIGGPMGRTGSSHGSVKSSTGSNDQTLNPQNLTIPANEIESLQAKQARQKLDNWQSRQLRDLEKFQPNLLLGVLPTEY